MSFWAQLVNTANLSLPLMVPQPAAADQPILLIRRAKITRPNPRSPLPLNPLQGDGKETPRKLLFVSEKLSTMIPCLLELLREQRRGGSEQILVGQVQEVALTVNTSARSGVSHANGSGQDQRSLLILSSQGLNSVAIRKAMGQVKRAPLPSSRGTTPPRDELS
jgi:hypothetical protein